MLQEHKAALEAGVVFPDDAPPPPAPSEPAAKGGKAAPAAAAKKGGKVTGPTPEELAAQEAAAKAAAEAEAAAKKKGKKVPPPPPTPAAAVEALRALRAVVAELFSPGSPFELEVSSLTPENGEQLVARLAELARSTAGGPSAAHGGDGSDAASETDVDPDAALTENHAGRDGTLNTLLGIAAEAETGQCSCSLEKAESINAGWAGTVFSPPS